jgi:hypothetical protein
MNTTHPVYVAVMPLKSDAVARAERHAREVVADITKALADVDGRINAVAPRANSIRMGRKDFAVAQGKRRLYDSLTRGLNDNKFVDGKFVDFRSADYCVEVDTDSVERFVKIARDEAAVEYDAFVLKLISKVGDVTAAELAGSHVWGHSVLTVVTAAGETQRWKTQMIVNVSVHGKLFNQFPTRMLKK